jgi:hypothetical protein
LKEKTKLDFDEKNPKQIKIQFAEEFEKLKPIPQEFEKDEDLNYHVDFIQSFSNCRAMNYKID